MKFFGGSKRSKKNFDFDFDSNEIETKEFLSLLTFISKEATELRQKQWGWGHVMARQLGPIVL